MLRSARWSVVLAASLVTFGVGLWLARSVELDWLPHAEPDRWVVAAAFATVASGVVGTATGWWAGRDAPAEEEVKGAQAPLKRVVVQRAKATGDGEATQIGGHRVGPNGFAELGNRSPDHVEQDAEVADRGRLSQVGGDDQYGEPEL